MRVSEAHQPLASEWLLVFAAEGPQAPEILAAGQNASRQPVTLPPRPRPGSHEVQVGAFRIRANAERLWAEMKARYGHSRVALNHGEPPLWRVLVEREEIPADREPLPAEAPPGTKAPTGNLVFDQVVQQVLPEVSRRARDTIQGTVRVRVKVRADASGSVVAATLDSSGPSRYFAELALQAARSWKFSPAKFNGRMASNDWILRFEFARTATRVFPVLATQADKIGKS